ncbi:amino acid transporter [Desulfosalsimonas propionicica]|uniref:Amino acid transporter n=1 Tax=Desulfosalsimonas propionicica TaxID=332175 RepID=A0A7W0HJG7_9BACT|nr:amino acid permease [Desulfosalsimonas propionicica]MBA2880175.1 amino acid transporter [Desulfosalsimonas propionicica]
MSPPAAGDKKAGTLGTFSGVFTPSILTILGIILFLRLGYVVGSAGLIRALVIIALANLISVLTSLSLAAISTSLNVKGGGDYYLISRTLGLEFGGAIGIVLFLAQSVSIAFYSIGFGEVLAALLPFATRAHAQIIAAAAVVLLFVFAWLGADWAARLQSVIMVVLFAAILSFFVGGILRWDTAVLTQNLATPENGPPFWVIFAIFFPAVTGFTQGVSMSGDLKDPGKSLPNGTFAAVGLSIVIYLAAAVVFAGSLPGDILATDYNAMKRVAAIDALVLAGVISATLSSGMASFMGAPRILQSLSKDRIFPILLPFAKGSGPADNPRRAVLLSAAIAFATIALGNLNVVAPVVSMFFLISYGLLNYATFFEARAASPSFRPTFRLYDKHLSLAGGLACLGAMLAIDLTAGIVALAFLSAIYQYLTRTAGPARWADSRRSYRFQQIRNHLIRAAEDPEHPRNWRPALLIFSDDPDRRKPLLQMADWIQGDSGFASMVKILQTEGPEAEKQRQETEKQLLEDIRELEVDVFPLVLTGSNFRLTMETLIQAYGIGPLRANTMITNWLDMSQSSPSAHRTKRFGLYLQAAFARGCNILLFSAEKTQWERLLKIPPEKRRMDVWWRGDATSRLMILFAHMIRQNPGWEKSKIRVLDVSEDALATGKTVSDIHETLTEIRIEAEPEIVARADSDAVAAYSKDASIVFLPFQLRQQQPVDLFDSPLSDLLSRLPVSAAMLAAKDIDLAAEPEAGTAGDIAAVLDRLTDIRKKGKAAEQEAQEASSAAEEKMDAWRRAIESGDDPENIRQFYNDSVEAKNRAVESGRKAAKLAAVCEHLTETAQRLGADMSEETEDRPDAKKTRDVPGDPSTPKAGDKKDADQKDRKN